MFQFLCILTNMLFSLSFFLIVAILTGVGWYLTVVFIYIFLIVYVDASFNMFIGHLCTLVERSILVHCKFLNQIFLWLSCSSLYILDINQLSDMAANIFSHSICYLFILLIISFAAMTLVCCSFTSVFWGGFYFLGFWGHNKK